MAEGMIQRAGDRGQGAGVCVPLRGTFIKGAAAPRQHLCLLSSVFCLLMPVLCCAEELPDPTRPPAELAAPAGGAAASQSAGLQSIIISRSRRAAIIDGQTVELGGKYGDSKLIEVNEGNVVLHGAHGRQVMTLFPDVKMTTAKVPARNEIKTGQKLKTKPRLPKSKAQPDARKASHAADKDGK